MLHSFRLVVPSLVSHATTRQFSSLIVRVGSGLSHGDHHTTRSHTTGSRTELTVPASRRRTNAKQLFTPSSMGERSIQVALSQTVHTHIDEYPVRELETTMGSADGKHEGFDVV